jgi:cobalt-zinc-cadmium resistance protein CzcA
MIAIATTQNELTYQVKLLYFQLVSSKQQYDLLLKKDSVFAELSAASTKKNMHGESSLLEKTTSEMRYLDNQNAIQSNRAENEILKSQLQTLLVMKTTFDVDPLAKTKQVLEINMDSASVTSNPYLLYLKQQTTVAAKEKSVAVNSSLPDIRVGYFNQSLYGVPLSDNATQLATKSSRFQGVTVGVSFPLWFAPDIGKAKVFESHIKSAELQQKQQEQQLQSQYKQAVQQYLKAQKSLMYYEEAALKNAEMIQQQSQKAYTQGELSYSQHLLNMQQAISIQENYTQTLFEYNKAIIYIAFFTAK